MHILTNQKARITSRRSFNKNFSIKQIYVGIHAINVQFKKKITIKKAQFNPKWYLAKVIVASLVYDSLN